MEWISVEDRLPGIDQMVLVLYDRELCSLAWLKIINNKYVWNHQIPLYGDSITHWMQLPELPED